VGEEPLAHVEWLFLGVGGGTIEDKSILDGTLGHTESAVGQGFPEEPPRCDLGGLELDHGGTVQPLEESSVLLRGHMHARCLGARPLVLR